LELLERHRLELREPSDHRAKESGRRGRVGPRVVSALEAHAIVVTHVAELTAPLPIAVVSPVQDQRIEDRYGRYVPTRRVSPDLMVEHHPVVGGVVDEERPTERGDPAKAGQDLVDRFGRL